MMESQWLSEFKNPWTPPSSGFVRGVPDEFYHGSHGYASAHGLMKVLRSPAHFHAMIGEGAAPEPSDALRFGKAVHAAILEPERFLKSYVVQPTFGQSKVDKEAKAKWLLDLPSDVIILKSKDELDDATGMLEALRSHRIASAMLTSGIPEISGFWTDPTTGVRCRIRPDFLREDGLCIDYKTTADASIQAFSRSAWNFGYHVSAAHYVAGVQEITGRPRSTNPEDTHWSGNYVFVAQEKKKPYAVQVYVADDAFLEMGWKQREKGLATFLECQTSGIWPGYPEKVLSLSPPNWAFYTEEE